MTINEGFAMFDAYDFHRKNIQIQRPTILLNKHMFDKTFQSGQPHLNFIQEKSSQSLE